MAGKGVVVSWKGGFGFIEDEADKSQHYVHFSALNVEPGGFRSLNVGQEVQFAVVSQDGRTRAVNVTALGGGPLPSGPPPPEGFSGGRGGRGGGDFNAGGYGGPSYGGVSGYAGASYGGGGYGGANYSGGYTTASASGLRHKGKVVSWKGGFGFIEDETDKAQHFVHFSALNVESGGFRALAVGQDVEFDVAMQDGRTKAQNVSALGGGPLPPGSAEGFRGGRGGGGFRGGRGGGDFNGGGYGGAYGGGGGYTGASYGGAYGGGGYVGGAYGTGAYAGTGSYGGGYPAEISGYGRGGGF